MHPKQFKQGLCCLAASTRMREMLARQPRQNPVSLPSNHFKTLFSEKKGSARLIPVVCDGLWHRVSGGCRFALKHCFVLCCSCFRLVRLPEGGLGWWHQVAWVSGWCRSEAGQNCWGEAGLADPLGRRGLGGQAGGWRSLPWGCCCPGWRWVLLWHDGEISNAEHPKSRLKSQAACLRERGRDVVGLRGLGHAQRGTNSRPVWLR